MQVFKVHHTAFDETRLMKSPLENKQSKPKINPERPKDPPEQVSYHETACLYEYDAKDPAGNNIKVVAPLLIEGPEVFTPSGVQVKAGKDGGEMASMLVNFDLTNADVAKFVYQGDDEKATNAGCVERLYRQCLQRVFDLRGDVKFLQRMNKLDSVEGLFNYPIFWPRDPKTSQVVRGKNPCRWFNIVNFGKKGAFNRRETQFTLPMRDEKDPGTDDKPNWKRVPWEMMISGVEARMVPLIAVKKITLAGGKAMLNMEIVSAVVTHIAKIDSTSKQSDTVAKIAGNAAVVASINQQIAMLTRCFAESKVSDDNDKAKEDKGDRTSETSTEPGTAHRKPLSSSDGPQSPAHATPSTPSPQLPLPISTSGIPGLPSANTSLAALMASGGPTLPGAMSLPQPRAL